MSQFSITVYSKGRQVSGRGQGGDHPANEKVSHLRETTFEKDTNLATDANFLVLTMLYFISIMQLL